MKTFVEIFFFANLIGWPIAFFVYSIFSFRDTFRRLKEEKEPDEKTERSRQGQ